MEITEATVTYQNRPFLLYLLYRLLRETLNGQARGILFARCGYAGGRPQSFSDIAARYALTGAGEARRQYNAAVAAVRRAVPGSPIAEMLCGFPAAWGSEGAPAADFPADA